MSFFEAIISGIVQGVTEFLPISSSGHLVILHRLIGLKETHLVFDIFLHLGTLAAIFIVFWNDILDIFTSKKRVGFFVIIGSAATVLFVLLFGSAAESAFSNVKLVGAMLIVTGAWLILGNFIRFGTEGMSVPKAFLIGLAQGIATLPGISRSGATISTGLFLGLDGKAAARFSFLLSIPAIIGAFLLKARAGSLAGFNINCVFGLVVSCIVGVLSLKLLLRLIYRNRFHLFGIYCIAAGILVLLLL
ncbi:MAG: undecaprenyl-diphosphate phosphatase [Candidatus Omnitrophica bacterium]|nr:undecaprenyl-diphosphate phosphatase [Candidatus Omnitrophota bacterium]